ncbi:MAG: alkaline phosphatase family protein, partial [Thermodesulfobacteriota bacterium]
MLLGLDCADPRLLFDGFRGHLPNLGKLMDEGAYGRIRSIHPPITAPAWASMLSGKSPGELGVYGFRHRQLGSYTEKYFAFSDRIRAKRVWDILSERGKRVIVLGVPQTFPVKSVNGVMVSSFLTPNTSVQYTHPPELKEEIERVSRFRGQYSTEKRGYMLDVENFRSPDKDRVLHEIYEMTEKQFAVMRHLMKSREWDFFATVFMGPDRVHHGFWKHMDPKHKDYERGNRYERAIEQYYKFIDEQIGRVLRLADGAKVLVVSDHGAKRLDGCICIDEWLIQNGYLKLRREPQEMEQLNEEEIDWSKTSAWGWGGYHGRVFVNLRGREPQGTVAPSEYEALRDELVKKLEAITDEGGRNIGTRAYRPEELYDEVNGDPPDLFVYFGDLYWRSSASIGLGSIYLGENDTGPDHANHDWDGIFIFYDPKRDLGSRRLEGLELRSVAPTILEQLRVPPPKDIKVKQI